ncbi:MAG: hypothetical protein ACMG6S_34245, partial [Byssovorax sp.]
FGRICTPRAWLSTWSSVSSNACLIRNLARIEEPTLVVHAGRDREITPLTDARPIFAAVASADRTFVEHPDARHYFEPDFGEPGAPDVERLMDGVEAWIRARFPISPRAAGPTPAAVKPARHPATATWRFPPSGRSPLPGRLQRVNLHELVARPQRFEHHLVVVAGIGGAQLEIVTASEPVAFAHQNISDEYVIALPTGDALIDAFPYRTFLTDPSSFADVGRLNFRVGDLVLNPHGLLHWPGRLRPPYQPMRFPAGMRRCGLSLVYGASRPSPPASRPLFVSAGREADAKAYGEDVVPFLLAETGREAAAKLAALGETTLDLVVAPSVVSLPRGGYLVVLDAAPDSLHFAGDLIHVPPGEAVPTEGLRRALRFSSTTHMPAAPPPSWTDLPEMPLAPFEDGPPGALPVTIGRLTVEAASPDTVALCVDGRPAGEIPRFWLARMLFRVALHGFALGYVETYGGFYYDDRQGRYRIGVRGHGHVDLAREEMVVAIASLYRAVAPAGYTERPA